ncbi:MAG: sigma-70 family RNA polymerase sigma factor [Fuerstiella sp.]|nr:sigma-70 family RNA polymerase sigma factor [Fuerstiella sp.]
MSAPAAYREPNEHNDTSIESQRVRRIIQREVNFIFSAEFERPGAERRILKHSTSQVTARRRRKAPPDVPGHLRHLWEIPLLSPDEETELFRRMNNLKHRSNVLRSRLNPARPNARHMDDIERMLSEATEVRNHIVRANARLVVSIARRFKHAADAFDEMISTGNLVLIKAVERFDYSRGFRFSTYATHSVQRELYRSSGKRQKLRLTEVSTAPEILLESVEDRSDVQGYEEQDRRVDYVRSLIEKVLPERERRVVISRFGLESDTGKTLREIGDVMGLSKERVRQLQLRALKRLQDSAMT